MFDTQVYRNRRQRLCQDVEEGLIVLPGHKEVSANYPGNTYRFRQSSSFLYYTGLDLPDLCMVIDVDAGKSMLFGTDSTLDDLIWTGPVDGLHTWAIRSGLDEVHPFDAVQEVVYRARKANRPIHFLPQTRTVNWLMLHEWTGISMVDLPKAVSMPLIQSVVRSRSIKSPEEILELEKAAVVGYEMHATAMKMALPGAREQHIAGVIEGLALSQAKGVSFPVILTQRGEVLHGHSHDGVLTKGKFLLCDAGAESDAYYASDYTRTVPVGGRFTERQRAVYQIVLDTNNKALSLIRPGLRYKDIHLEACRTLAEGLQSLGILKGEVEAAVRAGAHALFMPHGLGHMLGLDVHDMEDLGEDFVGYDAETSRSGQFGLRSLRLGRRLEVGFTLTVEPGIYFIPELIHQWESNGQCADFIDFGCARQFMDIGGIRLEDNVLVTEKGCRFLGQRLPIAPEEIEALF
jgi:Xaa-Pro aminopeptidase